MLVWFVIEQSKLAGFKEIFYNYVTKNTHVYCGWLAHAMCLEGEELGRILLIGRTNSSHACYCFRLPLRVHPNSIGVHSNILRAQPQIH